MEGGKDERHAAPGGQAQHAAGLLHKEYKRTAHNEQTSDNSF